MSRLKGWCIVALIVGFLGTAGVAVRGQGSDDLVSLQQQILELAKAKRYQEAIPLAQRLLSLAEQKSGPNSPDVAAALDDLVNLYVDIGSPTQAVPLPNAGLSTPKYA